MKSTILLILFALMAPRALHACNTSSNFEEELIMAYTERRTFLRAHYNNQLTAQKKLSADAAIDLYSKVLEIQNELSHQQKQAAFLVNPMTPKLSKLFEDWADDIQNLKENYRMRYPHLNLSSIDGQDPHGHIIYKRSASPLRSNRSVVKQSQKQCCKPRPVSPSDNFWQDFVVDDSSEDDSQKTEHKKTPPPTPLKQTNPQGKR